MMLHLGSGRSVPFQKVVALIDLNREKTRDTQSLVNAAKARGRLLPLGEPVKSLVLIQEKGEQWCFLSPFSVRTLFRRVHTKLK